LPQIIYESDATPASRNVFGLHESQARTFPALSGNGFRFSGLGYCKPDHIPSGAGSYKVGARWNAIDSFRASYHSLTKAVAVAEVDAHAKFYGFSKETLRPRLLVATEFSLSRVLDLTNAGTRRALDVVLDEIKKEDWRSVQRLGREGFCQGLGRAAFLVGAEALLAPSAQVRTGVNLVYFPENLLPTSRAQICNEAELEKLKYDGWQRCMQYCM
jgi:RES domain-containing protein